MSLLDRQVLALMLGPVKADLGASDTTMGLLGGLAFTLFYTALTMPMAWLADTCRRIRIIGWGVLFWSADHPVRLLRTIPATVPGADGAGWARRPCSPRPSRS